jgi:raffinose/stachyose/melibiose transport system permease protein
VPLWWAAPGLLLVAAFVYAAFFAGSWYSFTNWNGVSASAKWVGLDNFKELFSDPSARGALWHTIELTISTVICVNVIGLGLALGLHRTLKARNWLRAAFFAPVVLSSLAVSYVWLFLFSYSGPINHLLGSIGLKSLEQDWTGSPRWAIWTIFVVIVWQFSGLAMTLYLAGLQSISDDVDEAAAIDGASTWFRLRKVTFPLLAPAVTISVTMSTISGLRAFDQVMALTAGGPANATSTLATQIYSQGFLVGQYGYGAAYGVVLTLLVGVVAVAQVTLLRRREGRL